MVIYPINAVISHFIQAKRYNSKYRETVFLTILINITVMVGLVVRQLLLTYLRAQTMDDSVELSDPH